MDKNWRSILVVRTVDIIIITTKTLLSQITIKTNYIQYTL